MLGKTYKNIFKRDIAIKLRDMGNPIYDAIPNSKKTNYIIYIFEETEKFNQDLTVVLTEENKNKNK